MTTSNREIGNLFDKYNPNKIRSGDRVVVKVGSAPYQARVVGLEIDIKNQKVFANLKLFDTTKRNPIRVDVADCTSAGPLYPGHHNNGE